MGFFDFIFGTKKRQVMSYLKNNALILDVRTQREWDRGHLEQARLIPLDDLNNRVEELQSLNRPVIVCCESGVRSSKAAKFLNLHNIDAINGGGWVRLSKQL
ncbi:MAG: rhodanese-like domain-containing protein [Algicola sp.]|nr:rhodanese-like domain-containing protein [Algicola sp.]